MKLARDTWLTFQYEVGRLLRNPINIAFTLLQPVTYLLFFTPFLESVLHVHSYGATFQIYVPSLFTSMGLFGGLFAGFTLLDAMREGVINRFRVTPLSRVGLMLGQQLRYVALIGIQCLVIAVMALALGMRLRPANFLLALVLMAMMALLGISISFGLAFFVPSETVLGNLTNGVAQPLSLLAGVLVPLTVAPLWIRHIALGNPWAWAANGMREIFEGQIGNHVVWEAGVILAGTSVVAVVLSSRLFTRELA